MYLDEAEYNKLIGMRGHFIVPDNFPEMGAFFVIDDPEGIALLDKKRRQKMNIQPNHPLAELLGCKLMGIEIVPKKEQTAMVKGAIRAALRWVKDYESLKETQITELEEEIIRMQGMIVECMGGPDE